MLGAIDAYALTDRVWQAGEAFARAAAARRGSRGRGRPPRARRRADYAVSSRPNLRAVRGDRDHRRALADLDGRPRSGSQLVVDSGRAPSRSASPRSSPARRSAVDEDRHRLRRRARRAAGCGARARRGRPGRSRRGRTARRRRCSSPISTPQPSTNGTRLEHVAPPGVLAGERLDDARRAAGRACESSGRAIELGDAPAAGRLAVQRPAVVALHERRRRGSSSSGASRRGHEVGPEVADVGVDPAHEVAVGRRRATSTARCPCPIPAASSGSTSATATTRAPSQRGDLGGGVGRAVVDHHDLVDERDPLHERRAGPWRRCGRRWPPRRGPGRHTEIVRPGRALASTRPSSVGVVAGDRTGPAYGAASAPRSRRARPGAGSSGPRRPVLPLSGEHALIESG